MALGHHDYSLMPASNAQAASALLEQCSELAALLGHWRESHTELHGLVQELATLVAQSATGPPSTCVSGRGNSKVHDSRAAKFAGNPSKRLQGLADKEKPKWQLYTDGISASCQDSPRFFGVCDRAEQNTTGCDSGAGAALAGEGGGDQSGDSASNGSHSSDFDLEVDEEWAARLRAEMEEGGIDQDDDDPVIRRPWLQNKLALGFLHRIEEASNEDETSSVGHGSLKHRSHSSSCAASSRSSSLERLWAGVREAGGSTLGSSPTAARATRKPTNALRSPDVDADDDDE